MEAQLEEILINTIELFKTLGPLIISLVIVIESVIPIIPVGIFVALNIIILGTFWGAILSWVASLLGCSLSFYICRKGLSKYLYQYVEKRPKFKTLMNKISNLKVSHMVLYLAVPFTPAFMFNLACGLTKVPYRRFLVACLIGKVTLVYFWSYIGCSIMDSIRNPIILLEIVIVTLLAYMISLLVQKLIEEENLWSR